MPGTLAVSLLFSWSSECSSPDSSSCKYSTARTAPVSCLRIFISPPKGKKSNKHVVPLRIVKKRSIAFASFFAFCVGASFFIVVYFVPIWFQAILGVSAVQSGIDTLAMLLAVVVASIVAGGLTTYLGYYTPFMYLGTVFSSIGAGLLTTFYVGIPSSQWIGYQIIFGLGIGFGMQQALMAAQTVLSPKDIPTGTAIVIFAQMLGGSLFASVAQNVFTNKFLAGLMDIQGIDPYSIISIGATELSSIITDPSQLGDVLIAYNNAITKTFQIALIMACISGIGAVGMEWKSVKKPVTKTKVSQAEKGEVTVA